VNEKIYSHGARLQDKIISGIDVVADNVASTLGPRGRNVILHRKDANPIITKDGVTVASFVELSDPVMNTAAQIIKQASSKTNTDAGDGTTTSTVLTRAILKQAQKYLIAGASPIELKRGIDKAVDVIVDKLLSVASPIASEEDVAHIATISSNGDKTIGKLIATAVDLAGKDGSITIEEARSNETSLDIMEGFRFHSGYAASAFITDERRSIVKYDNPLILVADEKIDAVDELMPVLEVIAREARPFIIITNNIEGQALAALVMNALRGTLKVAAIKAPRYGEERRNVLKDLAISVGAVLITPESGVKLKDVKLQHLGTAKTIMATNSITTIVGGNGDNEEIEKRIETLKEQIEQTESLHDCGVIQERITRLASGVAIIHVGAPTEIEMTEKKHRIEDALEAVKSAQQEGVVMGGGIALIRVSQGLNIDVENETQQLGANIIFEAVKEPLRQMALNAGESPDLILSKVLTSDKNNGWDFTKNKLVNMLDAGIIDPVKVTRCALQNAASVASTLIMTNFAIIESDN